MTQGVLAENISDQWQALFLKIQRNADLKASSGRNGRNEVTQRILAAVVMYKMAKKLTVVI